MKLHFEDKLDYQLQAIEAVCDVFRGQETCRTEFTVTMKAPAALPLEMFPGAASQQMALGIAESDLGVGNRLTLLDDELHANLADNLRDKESAKIECGRAHFAALHLGENPAEYRVARNVGDLLA